jgi:hypothetical protein
MKKCIIYKGYEIRQGEEWQKPIYIVSEKTESGLRQLMSFKTIKKCKEYINFKTKTP